MSSARDLPWRLLYTGSLTSSSPVTAARTSHSKLQKLWVFPSRRICVTEAQAAQIVAMFEPYREQVESTLEDFDEDTQSWRDYAGYCFCFIPDAVKEAAYALRNSFKAPT